MLCMHCCRILRGDADVYGALTDAQSSDLAAAVEAFLSDSSPEAELVLGADMRLTR